jgi:hypothetical protein
MMDEPARDGSFGAKPVRSGGVASALQVELREIQCFSGSGALPGAIMVDTAKLNAKTQKPRRARSQAGLFVSGVG